MGLLLSWQQQTHKILPICTSGSSPLSKMRIASPTIAVVGQFGPPAGSDEECPGDGRGSMIVLTAAGLRQIEQAAPLHVAAVRRCMIDLLTPTEITALDSLTHRVVAHLSAVEE